MHFQYKLEKNFLLLTVKEAKKSIEEVKKLKHLGVGGIIYMKLNSLK